MRFWDTSAIVPLLVRERTTGALAAHFEQDPDMVAWWGTAVEVASALARVERDLAVDSAGLAAAFDRLDGLEAAWIEIAPSDRVRRLATRLVRVHPLRAADALQLAAAIVAAEDEPRSLPLVTLDDRLAQAAGREGFAVITFPAS
jgi:predicted nucleic acid-binding protein